MPTLLGTVQHGGVACSHMVLLLSVQGFRLWLPLSIADIGRGVCVVNSIGICGDEDSRCGVQGGVARKKKLIICRFIMERPKRH